MPRRDHDLTLTLRSHPAGPWLLLVGGDLDQNSVTRLHAALDEVSFTSGATLIIDLSSVTYCDSTGITELVIAHNRARAAETGLALAGLTADLSHIMAILGLDQVFASYGSVEEAAHALAPS